MRSLMLAGTALALLASPAYAFNIGVIGQVGNNNHVTGGQADAPDPYGDAISANILAGAQVGNNNLATVKQKADFYTSNTAGVLQVGNAISRRPTRGRRATTSS